MNIGFDAKRLFRNTTGLGNYSRTLVRNLQEQFPNHKYHLYTDRIVDNELTNYFLDDRKFVIHEGPKHFKSLWRAKFIVNDLVKDNIDIYHGLSNELPFGIHHTSIKTVVTIHDLIFKTYPKQYKIIDRTLYDYKSNYAINQSNKIISISKATQSDIIKYYNPNQDKISIVYQACGQSFLDQLEKVNKHKIPSNIPHKYFLYVGSIIERKGLLNIAKAVLSLTPDQRVPIVIVGNGSKYLQQVKSFLHANGIESLFLFQKNINDQDLISLYKNAMALIYPSIMEGFGIPLIEAGLLSTPIISSNISSLPEAGGSDIIQVDPTNPSMIAQAMCSIVAGDYTAARCQLVKDYMTSTFDGQKLSIEMMELYLQLIKIS